MKKIILLLIASLTIISCSETKQELKRISFTSDSEQAIALMEEFMMNSENREAESDIQQKLIDSILKLDPNFAMAKIFRWWGAGETNRERIISAYESIDKVSDLEGRFISAEYERRINGNIVKQDQIMDKLIEDYPEHWQLRVNSGYIKNQLLDAKGSEKRWEEALELNPGSYEALTSLVFLHIESGASTMLPANDRDLEKAKAYLETVRALNPASSRPDRYMGNIYRKENDLDKALASYQKANNMIEDKESQLYRNGLLMQGHVYTFKGEYDEGREKYYEGRSGAMKNQDYQWSMAFTNYIAQGYLYQKDFASAISVLSEMQQTVESFEETELQKINRKSFLEFFKFIAFGHSQKPEETLASISKIKELNEKATQIRLSSSDLNQQQKERIILNRDTGNLSFDVWYNILFGNYDEARALLDEFSILSAKQLSYNPNSMDDFFKFSGYLNLMEGKPQEAIDFYSRVSKVIIDDDNYHRYFLALANKAIGNTEESNIMLTSLATDNFARWQNAIVKNLAKAQIETNL